MTESSHSKIHVDWQKVAELALSNSKVENGVEILPFYIERALEFFQNIFISY